MRRDGDDGNYVLPGTVMPEDAVSGGRAVFGVGFEYVFPIRPGKRTIFMRIEPGMAWACFKNGNTAEAVQDERDAISLLPADAKSALRDELNIALKTFLADL